jgi:hypothetical protein
LTKAFDCIAEGDSPKICSEAISSKGGEVSYLLFAKHDRSDVENKHTLGYTIFGEDFKFIDKDFPASKEDFEFGKKFWDISTELLASKQVKVHPVQKEKGGLQGVLDGMKQMKEGKVSGTKWVYKVDETA